MIILSIDIGIKTLALCLMDATINQILKWEILDISSEYEPESCCFPTCSKKVIGKKQNVSYCTQHMKSIGKSKSIPMDIRNNKLDKYTKKQLFEIVDKYQLQFTKKCTKKQLLEIVQTYKSTIYYDEIIDTNASTLNLIAVSYNITQKLTLFLHNISELHIVIIENQWKLRMKCIQGMLIQFFVISLHSNPIQHIECISSINKLKNQEKENEKTIYTERKKKGIQICQEILTSSDYDNEIFNIDYFNQHVKKDDLADCYLQCLWFIHHNQKKWNSL